MILAALVFEISCGKTDRQTNAAKNLTPRLPSLWVITLARSATSYVAAWRSGNSVGRINEVTVRQARLVLGWVTCTGSTPGGGTLFRYVTSHPGRLSLSSFQGR